MLRSVIAALVILPVCVLFVQLWRGTSTDIAFAEREREGVAYLDALNELTVAVVDAQSAAVAGQPVNDEALARALDSVAQVDERHGASLRAQERWNTLRAAVEALPDRQFPDRTAAYVAYGEVTELLLAQYARVRESSNLIRDPEGDAYHLQDGAAEELPEAIVATARFADLAVLLPARPTAERGLALVELIAAMNDVLSPADDLASNVQAAVESTDSRTMSSNLLAQVDRFRRSMDGIAAAAATLNAGSGANAGDSGNGSGAPQVSQLVQLRGEAQAAAAELAATMLTELDGLIADRLAELRRGQWLSVGALVVAIALAFAPIVTTYVRGAGHPAGSGPSTADRPGGSERRGPDQPPRWPELETVPRDPAGTDGTDGTGTGRRGQTVAAR
ncbi:hypothetical protein ACN27F_11090 [Solwaraspora sp. WMMB335]|uniref:hypothetical protein n=1 Tax=Solwaraspora sp. WMMB335 TaxID=3404118 RepID=UPI003B956A96